LPGRRRVIEFGATILEYFGVVAGALSNSENFNGVKNCKIE